MKDLDPAGLDALSALADEASFDRAAQRLAITQSAVSQRLRALEAQCGRPLVVRTRPLRLTAAGQLLLRYARQFASLRADALRALGHGTVGDERMPIAVNADSLATWLLPALDPIVQAGQVEGHGLELLVDDQAYTHEWLREGRVLGCVSAVATAMQGCSVRPLGRMRYQAVASAEFVARRLPAGLHPAGLARTPFLAFNRKDAMHVQWAEQACGVTAPRLLERHVPSSESYFQAVMLGWGIGILPELQSRDAVQRGELVVLREDVTIAVGLYWHQWRLGGEGTPPGLLDRIGQALLDGARRVLS